MCLAVPGKIAKIEGEGALLRTGKVEFGGVTREINLAYVPEAQEGDWVLVHAGFALSRLDEEDAARTLAELRGLAEAGGGMIGVEEDEPERSDP